MYQYKTTAYWGYCFIYSFYTLYIMLYNTNITNLQTNIQKNYFSRFICTKPISLHTLNKNKPFFPCPSVFSVPSSKQLPFVYEKKKNKISLFVNILMKSGKKTTALGLLEKSLYIFMQSIIKIKMQPIITSYAKNPQGENIFADNSQKGFCLPKTFQKKGRKVEKKERPNILLKGGLYSKNLTPCYALGFTNSYIFLDKYDQTRRLQKQVTKKNNPASFYSAPYKDKPPILKSLFKDLRVLGCHPINIFPTHRFLCEKYISFLEKYIRGGKIFPFIGEFHILFEQFYKFKIFNFNRLKTNKQVGVYVHMPIGLKKRKGCGIYQYPWYKCKYTSVFAYTTSLASTIFVNKQQTLSLCGKQDKIEEIKKKVSLKTHPLKTPFLRDVEAYNLPFQKKNLWYQNINKTSISWEKLSLAQKNCLIFSLYKAISNVKPPLECRSKRFGGSNRQIPATVSEHRQLAYAICWIIQSAQGKSSIQAKKKVYAFLEEPMDIARSSISAKGQLKWETRNIARINPTKEDFKYNNTIPILPEKVAPLGKKAPLGALTFAMPKASSKQPPFSEKSKDFSEKGKLSGASLLYKERPFFSKGAKFSRKSCKIPPYFCFFLADALKEAYYKRGSAVEKRNLWVDTALANRAYLRFRWW